MRQRMAFDFQFLFFVHNIHFKMLIKTDLFFPVYKSDEAPDGFQKVNFNQYKDIYIGLATKYDFWKYADHSTTDPSRLIAQVNNADFERREYVAV